ncbi:MAG: S8 family serine peptidase [Nocardioidaceae bacterium]
MAAPTPAHAFSPATDPPAHAPSPETAAAASSPATLAATRASSTDPLSIVDAGVYLVVLRDQPLASYRGELQGYPATAASAGRRFTAHRASVERYEARLLDQQRRVLTSVGSPQTLYSYTTALNGFAAQLTPQQIKQLRLMPDVLTVEPDRVLPLDRVMSSGPGFSRISGNPSVNSSGPARALRRTWGQVGGVSQAGKGVVIGMIDSGIWPENPSFDGVPLDRVERHTRFPGFSGECERGERWTAGLCNENVLAALFFVEGYGLRDLAAAEFASPRDGSGHGSHTAGLAAGNAGVDVRIDAQHFGQVSGMAPAAGLAVYKACWTAPDPADDGCSTVDIVKAIDTAVSDGVDVLNYSIGGGPSTASAGRLNAIQLAFLNAASGGVFVATSAGDTGPRPASVGPASPWVTTVGATNTGAFRGVVRLGEGSVITGSMVSDVSTRFLPLLYGDAAAAAGTDAQEAALCFPGSLDAAQVKGALVLCDRGVGSRVSKSTAVATAGGLAMVLANGTRGHTDADVHEVPTVHVPRGGGQIIKHYLATDADPSAALTPSTKPFDHPPTIADFSARGPAGGTDLLEPDLVAPGASRLAAVAPPSNLGRLWDIYSGTSMAAPQVAGLAAILASRHPRWSPGTVKSAMMTSAIHVTKGAALHEQGAGVLNPASALDPGLVFDSGPKDWQGYARGRGSARPTAGSGVVPRLEGYDLNSPSIAVDSLVGDLTVVRRVTNVSEEAETFVADRTGLRGIDVSVTPSTLIVQSGERRTFRVSFSVRRPARYGEYADGAITWRGSAGHVVNSPVVVRPEYVRAPVAVSAEGAQQRVVEITSTAGVTGTVQATLAGPVAGETVGFELAPASFDSRQPGEVAGTGRQSFTVRRRTAAVRFEAVGDSGDVDVYVYRDDVLLAAATSRSAHEVITIDDPRSGHYDVYTNAVPPAKVRDTAGDDTTSATLTSWVVPKRSSATAALTPHQAKVTGGEPFTVRVDGRQLPSTKRWFGVVTFDKSSRPTYVSIS